MQTYFCMIAVSATIFLIKLKTISKHKCKSGTNFYFYCPLPETNRNKKKYILKKVLSQSALMFNVYCTSFRFFFLAKFFFFFFNDKNRPNVIETYSFRCFTITSECRYNFTTARKVLFCHKIWQCEQKKILYIMTCHFKWEFTCVLRRKARPTTNI